MDDTSSGFLDVPRVRLEVRSRREEIHEVRHEDDWPIARTQYTKLYLSGQPESLSLESPEAHKEVVYPAKKGRAVFDSAGETLQLIVASDEIIPSPPYRKDASCNRGKHVLHLGGKYESYLLVPKVPPGEG